MSARRENLLFQWKKFKGFTKNLLKKRRAALGVGILVFYTAFALLAPYLTPYDPIQTTGLSGDFDPPTWWTSVAGARFLSQNMVLFTSPGFTTDSSFNAQGWNDTQNPPGTFTLSYNATNLAQATAGNNTVPVREQIDYSRAANSTFPPDSGSTITISKSFGWPYTGPPQRFAGSLRMELAQLEGISSVTVKVFIAKGSIPVEVYALTLTNQTLNGLQDPGALEFLDSDGYSMKALLSSQTSDPASFIFFGKGTYSYLVQLTIPNQAPSNDVKVRLFVDNLNLRLYGTSWGLLGTDQFGRDIFTELAWGARVSLIVGILASIVAIVIGLMVGLVAGYLGKIVDEVLMRSTDLLLVLPGLPLLIILASILGPSIWNVIGVIAFLGWPGFARIIRSQVLTLKERSFIEAARAAGSGVGHVIRKHIVPNVMGLTYVNLALSVPAAIVTEAALSFLGLRDPSVTSWGGMLNDIENNQNCVTCWWWVLPPGLSIALLSLSFILLGYALDEILNPRLRMRR